MGKKAKQSSVGTMERGRTGDSGVVRNSLIMCVVGLPLKAVVVLAHAALEDYGIWVMALHQ